MSTHPAVSRVYEMLNPKPKELLGNPNRRFIREGPVKIFKAESKKPSDYYLFLFSDCLLLTKRDGKKYWLRIFCNLSPGNKVEDVKDSSYHVPNVEFRLYSVKKTIIFFAASPEEKMSWMASISSVVDGSSGKIQEEPPSSKSEPPRKEAFQQPPTAYQQTPTSQIQQAPTNQYQQLASPNYQQPATAQFQPKQQEDDGFGDFVAKRAQTAPPRSPSPGLPNQFQGQFQQNQFPAQQTVPPTSPPLGFHQQNQFQQSQFQQNQFPGQFQQFQTQQPGFSGQGQFPGQQPNQFQNQFPASNSGQFQSQPNQYAGMNQFPAQGQFQGQGQFPNQYQGQAAYQGQYQQGAGQYQTFSQPGYNQQYGGETQGKNRQKEIEFM